VDPIFPKWINRIPRYVLLTKGFVLVGVVFGIWYWFSPQFLVAGYEPTQPVMFSHQLHAGQMGIDCRYCHSSIEKGSFAAVPPVSTCMGCHNKVQTTNPRLELVRKSFAEGKPIPWVHIHALPRHAHFDHSAHLNAGVGCVSCHGRVDTMEVVRHKEPLSMGWCLDCHRNPTPSLRPQKEITNLVYDPLKEEYDPSQDPKRTRSVEPPTHCGACHY
jgi:Cytochrome c7 and related cytochrome c/Class III cytochrome C family